MRLRVPDEGHTVVRDVIRGESAFENRLLDDFVIARADRTPLYNFAVAVDDTDMGITHVVRGEDHLSNTPRQLLVLEALGAEPPLYAHLPLLHGTDGKPLSKRHGAASVQELREIGYLPEAVRNYLALLGWGYDAETTFFTTDGPDREVLAGARVALAGRLRRAEALLDERALHPRDGHGRADAPRRGVDGRARPPGADDPRLEQAVAAVKDKISTLAEVPRLVGLRVRPGRDRPEGLGQGDGQGGRRGLCWQRARDGAGRRGALRRGAHRGRRCSAVVEETGAKPGAVYQPLRVAITGKTVSPGIFESLALLGRDEALARIDAALARA